jgi:hypothetical protein
VSVIFCASVVSAQDKMKPLLGEGTLAVVHVDLDKIDVAKTLNNNRQAIEKMFADIGLPEDKLHDISLDFVLADLASFSEALEGIVERLQNFTRLSFNADGVTSLWSGNETDEIPVKVAEPSEDFEENWKNFVATMEAVKKTLTETFGVREAFVIVSLPEYPYLVYLAIPKTEKLNAEKFRRQVKDTLGENSMTLHEEDDYIIITFAGVRDHTEIVPWAEKFSKRNQSARPDLLEAYEAVKDDAVKIIFAVPSYAKRIVAEIKPSLTKNLINDYPPLSAVDIPQFVDGLKFAAIGLNPEKGKIKTVVKMNSEQAAQQFAKQTDAILTVVLDAFLKELQENAEELTEEDISDINDLMLMVLAIYKDTLNEKSFAALKAQLILKPNGDTITLNCDAEKIKTLLLNSGITLDKLSRSKSVLSHVSLKQQRCRNRIRQHLLAIHNYLDANRKLPLPFSVDKDGKRLHSWRVLLLPYLNEEKLYKSIRLDEPWDSEYNKQFHKKMPKVFTCPSCTKGNPKSDTVYCMIVGEKAFGRIDGKALELVNDGFANTIGIAERATPICWMSPEDITIEAAAKGINKSPDGIGSEHEAGANVGIMDGNTKFLKNDFPLDKLKKLLTADAGD